MNISYCWIKSHSNILTFLKGINQLFSQNKAKICTCVFLKIVFVPQLTKQDTTDPRLQIRTRTPNWWPWPSRLSIRHPPLWVHRTHVPKRGQGSLYRISTQEVPHGSHPPHADQHAWAGWMTLSPRHLILAKTRCQTTLISLCQLDILYRLN